ncbi:MAG: hypothetical protein ABI723_09620 [Bacteroidia bacterium]
MQKQILKALIAGGMLVIMNPDANAQNWSLTGNAGTTSANFIGTTDNIDFRIKTKNVTRLTIKNNGKVGIGTAAPGHLLTLSSSTGPQMQIINPSNLAGTTAGQRLTTGSGWDVRLQTCQDTSWLELTDGANLRVQRWLGLNYYPGNSSAFLTTGTGNTNIAIMDGNLGVGTQLPAEKLEVTGNIRLTRGGARSLYIDDALAGVNGNDLTLQAGGTPIYGPVGASGGNVSINAGNTNSAGSQAGGNIFLTAGRNAWNNGVNPGARHGDIIFRGGGVGQVTSIVEHARIDGTTGAMALGTATPATGYRLTVAGKIICTELKVQAQPFPDYVFDSGYELKTIDQVQDHINTFKRLPGMPSACEVETNGMSVGEMQTKTVEKVEEMMLYIIQLKNQNEALQKRIELLEKK